MNDAAVIEIAANAMWTAAKVSAPMLLTALFVGLAIGLVQSVTQIQEATLTFVPKFVACGLALVLSGSWMLRELVGLTEGLFERLPQLING